MTRTWTSAAILVGLLGLVLVAVLIAPSAETGRSHSSYSAGFDGVRLARDLSARLGWAPEAREVPFTDTIRDPAPVQALVAARVGAVEAHALLEFVRRGGSLLVAGPSGAFSDSLDVAAHQRGSIIELPRSPECARPDVWEAQLTPLSRAAVVGWRRPPPRDTVGFGLIAIRESPDAPESLARPAVGFPLGAGRVVVVADENYVVNEAVRRCNLEADVAFVRMLEYLSHGRRGTRVAFDEFHHGYGPRGGSLAAIRMYLSGTRSGRMLAQMAVAGLLLLLAFAPRPLAPRDPSHVARRSPLEHADALAHAYLGVGATRTATTRLLAGVRRRTRRDRMRGRDSDQALLAAAAGASPEAAAAAGVVSHALEAGGPERDLPRIAAAVHEIERALSQRPTSPTR